MFAPFRYLRARMCKHNSDDGFRDMKPVTDYRVIRTECRGVILGWSLKPEVSRQALCHCNLCGADWWRPPGYIPGDPAVKRDAKGWPLNDDGSRMQIAEGS